MAANGGREHSRGTPLKDDAFLPKLHDGPKRKPTAHDLDDDDDLEAFGDLGKDDDDDFLMQVEGRNSTNSTQTETKKDDDKAGVEGFSKAIFYISMLFMIAL